MTTIICYFDIQGRSQLFQKGEAEVQNLGPFLAEIVKQTCVNEVNLNRLGSRACLRALEALVFITVTYAFSHFSWYFFFKLFNVHLCG